MSDRIDFSQAGEIRIKAGWLPVLVGSLLCILSLVLWRMLDVQENTNLRNKVKLITESQATQIETDLRNRIHSLQRMVRRWEIHRGTPKDEFINDAKLYLADAPGFQALGWVDKNGYVRWIIPFEDNIKELNLNLAVEKNQRMVMEKARGSKTPAVTLPLDLASGGKGFLTFYPIYFDAKFQGYIVAVFHIQAWLDYVFNLKEGQRVSSSEFKLSVFFDDQLVYKQAGWDSLRKYEFSIIASVQIMDHKLHIGIRPTVAFVKRNKTLLPELTALFGLLLSILVSFIVHLFQKAQLQTCKAQSAKTDLEVEVLERKKIEYELQQALEKVRLHTFIDITERKRVEAALEKRIVALTQPLNSATDISFEDLFNISDIQRLQDILAETLGVAALITRPDGTPITQPSNFSKLCQMIRKTPNGVKNCISSDALLGQYNPLGPTIRPCLSAGLCNAGSSIVVGGSHIANWLISQVRNETQREEDIMAYAREIGVDETEFRDAYEEVPVMSQEQFNKAARLLFEIANQISTIAYQNIQQARFITERKRVEEFLRSSEARYRALVENQDDLISRYRPDTTLTFVNDAYCQFYGKTRDELIGNSFLSMVAPEFHEAVLQEAESIVKDQKLLKGEYKNYRQDGQECFIQWVIKGILDENGEVFEIQAVGRDITRLKQIEEEIRKSEAKLKEAQHIARLGNWEADLINHTLQWSEGVYAIFEINPIEFDATYEAFVNAFHPDDREMVNQTYTKSLKNRTPYEISHRLLMKDGRIKWVNQICRTDYDPQGNPIKSFGIVQDITEQKLVEEALRDSQQKFQGLVETLYDWVWEVDSQGRYTYVSPQIKNILGYEPQEIIGKTPYDLMPPEEIKRASVKFTAAIKERKPIAALENINLHKDGHLVVMETNGLPFYDVGKNLKGYRGTDRDITHRKQVEEMIRHMATHDGLTDLPSMRLARERLSMAVSMSHRRKTFTAVMFVDLDGFKTVNDTYGHDVGDGVLIEVAKRLSSSMRETDTVARIGGDEFLLVVATLKSPEDAAVIAAKVNQLVSQPIILSGLQVSICASIGIAVFPRDTNNVERLIKLADEAMYKVKTSGKNGYKFA